MRFGDGYIFFSDGLVIFNACCIAYLKTIDVDFGIANTVFEKTHFIILFKTTIVTTQIWQRCQKG